MDMCTLSLLQGYLSLSIGWGGGWHIWNANLSVSYITVLCCPHLNKVLLLLFLSVWAWNPPWRLVVWWQSFWKAFGIYRHPVQSLSQPSVITEIGPLQLKQSFSSERKVFLISSIHGLFNICWFTAARIDAQRTSLFL